MKINQRRPGLRGLLMVALLMSPIAAVGQTSVLPQVASQPAAWTDIPILAAPRGLEARAVAGRDGLYVCLVTHECGGNVYLAVDPYRDGLGLYRVVVSSSGVPTFTSTRKTGWACPGVVEVRPGGRGWECVVRIPFEALTYPSAGCVQWTLGVGRTVDSSVAEVISLTVPVSTRPNYAYSASETSLVDGATVNYAVTPTASVNVVLPTAPTAVEFDQYRPFFQSGAPASMDPLVTPAFQERVDFLTGSVTETVGYQSSGTSEGASMAVGWTSKPLPYVDKVHVGLTWAELKSPDGEIQSEAESLSASVHVKKRWDLSTNLEQQDTLQGHDSQVGTTVGYTVKPGNRIGVSVSEGTQQQQPETSINITGTLAPTRKTQVDVSYLTSDALIYSTTPVRNRVWHGDVRYSLSKWHSFTLGVREDAQGTCNLYGVYRREMPWDKEMILTLGDPSASTTASQVLLKVIDRL